MILILSPNYTNKTMSVVCKADCGAVIDHLAYTREIYYGCRISNKSESSATEDFSLKPEFFNIHSPFMMDTQFEKRKNQSQSDEPQVNRKRKRKSVKSNAGLNDAVIFHNTYHDFLHSSFKKLLHLAQELGNLLPRSEIYTDNNIEARQAANWANGQGFSLVEQSNTAQNYEINNEKIVYIGDTPKGKLLLFNTLVKYTEDFPSLQHINGNSYLFPPHSSFFMSDFTKIPDLLGDKQMYDHILIDPPWQNKSVSRKRRYGMLFDDDLVNLPIPDLAKEGCLVVVWATNKQHQHRLIRDHMFPKWGIKLLAQWFWMKITKHGVPVVTLDDPHKKPYETIFLGYKEKPNNDGNIDTHAGDGQSSSMECASQPSVSVETRGDRVELVENETSHIPERLKGLPSDYVIASVPSSIHSHKPPLIDVLHPYLPSSPDCLELFARNLLPNHTSWGNEVLKLQHMDFYRKSEQLKTQVCINNIPIPVDGTNM